MKAKIKVTQEVNIATVKISAGVRYWEDATVNGIEDTNGTLIPFRNGDAWEPEINLETGTINNWPVGTTADIHYKVCDAGDYFLKDDSGNVVATIEQDYVPNKVVPGEYGDYIIMKVDESGKIENWKEPSFDEFPGMEEDE